MSAVGIVAEYNPFHKGHAYHIAETKRLLGEERPVVCVMSGNWVQRGECAITDKWTRTAAALKGGADLILELPLPWAISSAESFAQGAIAILEATGVIDTFSFGSESGQVKELLKIAKALESESYQAALREEVNKGQSFADARQKAAFRIVGKQAYLLRGANDSLGVEYMRAAGDDLAAVAVLRKGVAHDGAYSEDGFASASYLRENLRGGGDVSPWVDEKMVKPLQTAGIAKMKNIERAIFARLRQMSKEDFAVLPDSGAKEGLPDRLIKAAKEAEDLESFYELAKTRRYAHARIRRLVLWAFLGMRAENRSVKGPCYLRVLGMNGNGKRLLKEMKAQASLPILTKPAHIRDLEEEAQTLFALESRGTDLFGLCFDKIRPCGMDYTTGPVIF